MITTPVAECFKNDDMLPVSTLTGIHWQIVIPNTLGPPTVLAQSTAGIPVPNHPQNQTVKEAKEQTLQSRHFDSRASDEYIFDPRSSRFEIRQL